MDETRSPTPLLDADFLRRLDQLSLVARKLATGKIRGERRSKKKGISVDFADYRNYVRGDDPRFIDWNIFGRLDRLFLKLYQEEEDLRVYLIIDTSESMRFGEPSKFDYARRLAAALGYVALVSYDRVTITAVDAERAIEIPSIRTRGQVWKLFAFLEQLTPSGRTDLPRSMRDFSLKATRRGIVILLSDFMDPRGYEPTLAPVIGRRHEVFAMHTMAPEEIDPDVGGHLTLVDSETDEEIEVTVTDSFRDVYRHKVAAYVDALKSYCSARDVSYLSTRTDFEVERLVLEYLRRVGLIR